MKCLVVTAHPLSDSLCKSLTLEVLSELKQTGHEVMVEDLYEKSFDPRLSQAERYSYYAESGYDQNSLPQEIERLLEAEAIILLFPTWWFAFPAILKGWFDRVWAPGVAYDHADDYGPIKPRLKNLKKMMVITTLGSPWWVDYLILWRPVKRNLKIALLATCAPQCQLEYLSLYQCERLQPKKVNAYIAKIKQSLSKWPKT